MKFKNLKVLCLSAMLALSAMALVGVTACSDDDSSTSTSETDTNTLAAPTDFTYDPDTGEFSFTANDENAGYYYVRVFSVINGEESSTYTASSTRINGGTTGTMSGSIDTSDLGWGEYHLKLVTFKASGTSYTAPDPVVLTLQAGVGGVLEKPEYMIIQDNAQVELVVDWYTLRDYYYYQCMPNLEINFYTDEALTTVAYTETVDLQEWVESDSMEIHPIGGIMWGHDATSGVYHGLLTSDGSPAAYVGGLYDFTEDLSENTTYYVTIQAISPATFISDSQVSDTLTFTTGEGDPDDEDYAVITSDLWMDPTVMGKPLAADSTDSSNRVDYAASQTVTSQVVS